MSYRRADSAYPAGWLYDRLADHYGGSQVFKDVDSIELGDDFVEVITEAVGSCDVLLALIGEKWLNITDANGHRRIDDPNDFVRLEIEAALARNVRVIPILVDGARMPTAEGLPDSLNRLARRQALELSPARFDFDTGRLLKKLDRELAEIRASQTESDAPHVVPQAAAATLPPAPRDGRRHSTQTWLLVGTGVAVVLILLIVAVLANNGTPSSPAGAESPSTSAGTATTFSPANKPVLFRDDFSSRAAGWQGDGAVAEGAGYTRSAYRISAPPAAKGDGAGSVPLKASRVWPSAPPQLRITVEGHRLAESDQSMGYGILCRINGDRAYVLTISDNQATIEKWGPYKLLKDATTQVGPNSTNKLRAVCTDDGERQGVHLELWVNGAKVVETTDTDAPLPTGGVGLAVTTDQTTRASVAEFDNFVVEQVA
jgi:hypothetical protein